MAGTSLALENWIWFLGYIGTLHLVVRGTVGTEGTVVLGSPALL